MGGGVDRYVEVFGGAGWVLFSKEAHKVEVFNDIDRELVNLFKIVKYHSNALQEELEFLLNSRETFNEYKKIDINYLTDIQRAARYFYLVTHSFAAKKDSYARNKIDINKKVEYLSTVKERLKNVIIENKSYNDLMLSYDSENTLFYCDPPYFSTEKYYKSFQFEEKNHIELKNICDNLKAKIIISYNDCEYIRNLYKDYNIIAVDRNHNLKHNDRYNELIIKNY